MSTEVIYTLFYLILCLCVIYPPDEFMTAGFTMPDLFYKVLGSESEQFVLYHIKRSSLTVIAYSFLPFGYILGSVLMFEDQVNNFKFTQWINSKTNKTALY